MRMPFCKTAPGCLAAVAALAVLLAPVTTGCAANPFDTNIPKSEDFDAGSGTWSPDGSKIAFAHSETLTEPDPTLLDQLWIADLNSGERWQVVTGRISAPDWSPDGNWFVFHSFSDPEYLFKVDAGGNNITRLTGQGSPNPGLRYTSVGRWRPDGSQIMFNVVAGEPRGIATMDPDGSDASIIIPYGIQGSWYPDGSRILYVNWDMSKPFGSRRQIYTSLPDGTDIRKLTSFDESEAVSTPHLSPDGNSIVFVHRGRSGRPEIFVMNSDGSNVRQVTEGPGYAWAPRWHRDGDKIVFTRTILNESRRLYLLETENKRVRPVFPLNK